MRATIIGIIAIMVCSAFAFADGESTVKACNDGDNTDTVPSVKCVVDTAQQL